MTKAILEIYRSDDPHEGQPWAWNIVNDISVIPAEGEFVLLRTPERGGFDANVIKVSAVTPLASLDGYRIAFILYADSDDTLFLKERAIRRDLLALEWQRVAPARPLDSRVDVEDYDGLEGF